MSRTLAIHVDTQCLFPHQVDDSTFLVLGVSLQTAFEDGFTDESDFPLLNPWRWNPSGNPLSLDVYFLQPGSGTLLAQIPSVMPSTAGTDETDAVAALQDREAKLFHHSTLTSSDPAPFLWNPSSPNSEPPAQGHVLHLLGTTGRLAGTLSARLNLTAVLNVSRAAIVAANPLLIGAGGSLVPVQILVAPRFQSNNGLITYTPQAIGPNPPEQTGLTGLFRWPYDVSAGSTDRVNAYGVPVTLTTGDSPNRFIQLATNWVLASPYTQSGTAQLPDPGVDWHTQLAEKVAAAWDTPRLLLDATRDCISIPHFNDYWTMLLAALRDRASLGVIETPDGMSLLEYAIRLAIPQAVTTDEKWLLEGQLTSLIAKMRLLDVNYQIDDWLDLLVANSQAAKASGIPPLLPDLVGKLPRIPDKPSRQMSLTWSATNNAGIAAATAANSMYLVRYSRLDEPITTIPGGGPLPPNVIQLTPAVAGQPDLDRYSTRRLANGDFAVVISPGNCSPVLTAGWYEAAPNPCPTDAARSARVFVPPGVPDDVAPVARALAELNQDALPGKSESNSQTVQDTTLSKLLNRQWSEFAARNPLGSLATGQQSRPWFTSIETHLPVASGQPATTDLLPEISVADGRFWVTTLAGIALGADNDSYALEFRNGSFLSDNLTQAGDEAIAVKVTRGTTGVSPKLDVAVTLLQFGAAATALATGTISNVSDPYHLRVELNRAIQQPPAPPAPAPAPPPQQVLRLLVFVGQGAAGNVQWQPAMTPPGGAGQPATQMIAVTPLAGLERLGLVIRNDLGAASALVAQSPPTLLPVSASLVHASQANQRQAWDHSFDQGKALWNRAADEVRKRLPGLSLRQRLALAQTARLWPIWNDLAHGQGNLALALQQEFRDQFVRIFDQRFNFSGDKAAGIYRNFSPEFTFPSDPTAQPLRDHLTQFLNNRADTIANTQPLVPAMSAVSTTTFAAEQPADQYPTKIPHAVNLQVDTEHNLQSDVPIGQDDDLQRRISGYGVMIRQAAADSTPHFSTPWSLLNFVDLNATSVSSFDPANPFPISICQGVPAPVPLQHQNAARQTTLSFNNRSFLAHSPLNAIGQSYFGDPPARTLSAFRYQVRTVPTGNDWGRFPSLKFGQLYQLIPFVMGNCCSLPRLLSPQHPTQLRTDSPSDADLAAANPPIRQIKYLRRVDIGQPRRADPPARSNGSNGALGLPAVPPLVRLLTGEWGLSALTYSQADARFFYDETKRVGLLENAQNWAVVLPRVTVAGRPAEPDGASSAPINFSILIGLAWLDPSGQEQTFGVTFNRTSSSLQVGCGGTAVNVNLVVPGAIQPLQNGALDLRVLRTANTFCVSWRRSDHDEPWQDVAPTLNVPLANPPDLSWLAVKRTDAPANHQASTSEPAITFGTPKFSQNFVPAGDATATLTDDDLSLRAVDLPHRTSTVLDPYGQQTQVALNVRPPSTDLETWDRWFAMDAYLDGGTNPPQRPWSVPPAGAALDAFRKKVWTDYYNRALTRPKEFVPTNPAPDSTIDDPAVDLLVIELVPLLVETSASVLRLTRPLNNRTTGQPAAPGIEFLQYRPIPFQIAVQKNNGQAQPSGFLPPGPGDPPGLVKIAVTEQEIWELRIYPAAKSDWFTPTANPGRQRFHSQFTNGATFVEGVTPYRLSDPWCVVLEVATQDVLIKYPSTNVDLADALLRAIRPSFVSGRRVEVALNKQDPRIYRYMSNLRLSRQVWRWQGRPEPSFPFWDTQLDPGNIPVQAAASAADLDSPETAMGWDAAGFGDRSTIDMFDETRHIDAESSKSILFSEDLGNDPRALYYRFTGEAQSRYAALYPANPPVVKSFITSAAPNQGIHNAWQRLIVPCRRTEQVPRPAVRFVVPLTESEDDKTPATVPGLLVVLDEPWFAVGGLSEQLEAEIVQCSDYYFPGTQATPIPPPNVRPEFGPDPVLRGVGWTQAGSTDPSDSSLAMDVVGPIGHTFDTSAESPLFNASSFVLRPPKVAPPNGDTSLAWYFAKIRFRRALLTEAMIGYVSGQPQTTDFSQTFAPPLDPSRDWVIDISQMICSSGTPTNATVNLGTLGSLRLTVGTNELKIQWQPMSVASPTAVQDLLLVPSAKWTQATIDIRFVLQLDAAANEEPSPPPRHLTVEYRLRHIDWATTSTPDDQVAVIPLRTWRILQVQTYTEAAWPANIAIIKDALISFGTPTPTLAQVSPFTSPYWVQFLPEAQLLQLPTGLAPGKYGIHWRPNVVNRPTTSFYLTEYSDDRQGWLKRTQAWHDKQGWPADPVDSSNPGTLPENSQVRFQRRVLLTSLISDIRGQMGQERYVGLYRYSAPTTSPTEPDCFLQEVHRSPAFDIEQAKQAPRLRARVVEFQAVGLMNDGQTVPALKDDSIWSDLFASTTDDVQTRLVRVSPPLELVPVTAST